MKTPGEVSTEEVPTPPTAAEQTSNRVKTPLFRPEQLLVDGVPVFIAGDRPGPRSTGASHRGGNGEAGDHGSGYGGHTDLAELDGLGMHVALTYERNRLRREGLAGAEIFDSQYGAEQPTAVVFDVSTLGALAAARGFSPTFREAFASLERQGISTQAPGFDILTLNHHLPNGIDRIIELKSSGVNARLQEMSWNEWKSAQNGDLRSLYYLYLVGNLRSDLGDAVPFIRTVHDPFAAIWAEEIHENSRSRKIQLHVSQFTAAEHLDLGVRKIEEEAPSAGLS